MQNIPTYVYILFIALMYLGYKRCFTRTIRVERLILLPLIFIVLSVRSMINLFDLTTLNILLWLIGGAVGLFLGYIHVYQKAIKADHEQKLLTVPGDWSMLVLIFFIFVFEFFVHYSIDAQVTWTKSAIFVWCSTFILGAIAGMTAGRNLTYAAKYKSSPSEHLILSQ